MVEELLRAPASSAVSPVRRPLWARFSKAHVAIGLTAALAGVLNLAALRQQDARTPVLTAAAELAAGARLSPADVRVATIAADASLTDRLVPAARLEQRLGWIVQRAVRPGEPLRWSDLRAPDDLVGLRAMSVAVEPEHAVAGTLRTGDRVDVIGVREGQAYWVLADVEVLDTGDPDGGEGLAGTGVYTVTIAVSEAQALRLALALREGSVEVVRANGAPPLGAPEATAGGDPASAAESPEAAA